jgi:GNAT superfamily N-acetyltransferase
MTHTSLTPGVIVAKKSDKKSILRFYKENHYPARFIGFDHCYLIKVDDNIIASVISSQGNKSQLIQASAEHDSNNSYLNLPPNKTPYLLHALLVAPSYRRLGYAEHLLSHAIINHQPLICFAQEFLKKLYLNNGFIHIEDNLFSQCLPADFYSRFQQYSKNKPELRAFVHQNLV